MIFLQEIVEVRCFHCSLQRREPFSRTAVGAGEGTFWQGWGRTWHGTALFGYIHPPIPGLVQTGCTARSFLPVLISTSDFIPRRSGGEVGDAHAQQTLAPAASPLLTGG